VFVYHTREALRAYFRHARRSLLPGGVVIIDAYGGPGAMRVGEQRRAVPPQVGGNFRGQGFEYRWEQRSYDAVTGKVDCRIHFRVGKRTIRDAFVYDWRLWSLPELVEVMREAGFRKAEVWCDTRQRPGVYRAVRKMETREDWVAYVVGVR
jgi:hypothetical protein